MPPKTRELRYSEAVLEHFMVGFPGREVTPELADLLACGLAGVAIYPRNFRDPAELRTLTTSVRAAAGRPVLIGIDQEGGTKFSLAEPFTAWPSPAELGTLNDTKLTEEIARATARELLAVGINLNFAPMLDLATNPDSPITSVRSLGPDPERVATLGCAVSRGLEAEGILACAKHFPGHGDTAVDPHLDLPRFDGTRERLMHHELVPFAAAIRAGVSTIMTAHILLPNIDSMPASLSGKLLQTILREELGFEGLVLADDLGMGAIARHYRAGESAVRTLRAGADIAMLCHDWSLVPPAIKAAAEALSETALAESHSRIEGIRSRIRAPEAAKVPPLETIGCAEHRALAEQACARIAARAS